MGKLDELRRHGFDESHHIPFTKTYKVKCSCCEALVLNGAPCHERGCSNQVHECPGCENLIPRHGYYCEDCQAEKERYDF